MKQWRKVRLGDILTESKIESLSPNNKTRIRVLLNTKGIIKRPVMNEKKGATKYFSRKKGQFIYGKQNIHKGAFGVIPDNLDNFESTSDLPAFDVDKKCLPIWIDYYLKQGNFYLSLVNIARGVATKRVQTKELFELKIPLPTIKEQKIIVKKLKDIETEESDLKQEIIQQQALLKKLRQQILQEAIEGKLTQDWRVKNPNIEPASELLKRIQAEKQQLIKDKKIKAQKTLSVIKEDEKPFKLPDSWAWCNLNNLVSLLGDGLHGTPVYSNVGEFYFINGNNLTNGKIQIKKNTKTVD
jgi:restriction endonuclease S subunit